MTAQTIISRKRDGAMLSPGEIAAFIKGVCDGTWADYQTTALLMAMYLRGLNAEEQSALTREMLRSGEILDFSDLEGAKADKHSTGGVGDKTSLIVAPLAAACGVAVPMISGRGLGHTGGTLDKLESIVGYNVNLDLREFKRIVRDCGFAMIGQTAEIAPADKKLYALRDATATVDSIPLIVASIMSKKLAEGLDALVLDVKTGSGAFMQNLEDAQKLARALIETGTACGVKTNAVISNMNQPLGKYVGNALEVYECIEILRGNVNEDARSTYELSLELTAQMLVAAGVAENKEAARAKCSSKLLDGTALEKLRENVELQGGDWRVCDQPELLRSSELFEFRVKAASSGFVSRINTKAIGEAVCAIGGGRNKASDAVDHAVGYACERRVGDETRADEVLGVLFCRSEAQANQVYDKLRAAYEITLEKPSEGLQLIKSIIS